MSLLKPIIHSWVLPPPSLLRKTVRLHCQFPTAHAGEGGGGGLSSWVSSPRQTQAEAGSGTCQNQVPPPERWQQMGVGGKQADLNVIGYLLFPNPLYSRVQSVRGRSSLREPIICVAVYVLTKKHADRWREQRGELISPLLLFSLLSHGLGEGKDI